MMASTLSYINKLSGHLIASKNLRLLQQKIPANQCKQYSRSIQNQNKLAEDLRSDSYVDNGISDNKEMINDIVTKFKVDRLDVAERLYTAPAPKDNIVLSSETSEVPSGKPSADKLLHVYNVLGETLPKLFITPMDYTIYHEYMVFEDNIRNVRTEGLLNYVKQVALLRTVGHIKFAYVKFDILKITQHPEDGTVRIRWSIRGISALKVMFQFWKFKLWEYKDMLNKSDHWYDGYSTFFVNADGKVVKHVADKMMPDSDQITERAPSDVNNAKLALMIAVIPRFSDVGLLM